MEECLSALVPSEFSDDNLQRLVGLQWVDFVDFIAAAAEHDRKGSAYSAATTVSSACVQGRYSVM